MNKAGDKKVDAKSEEKSKSPEKTKSSETASTGKVTADVGSPPSTAAKVEPPVGGKVLSKAKAAEKLMKKAEKDLKKVEKLAVNKEEKLYT
jgi:hypothetical protein